MKFTKRLFLPLTAGVAFYCICKTTEYHFGLVIKLLEIRFEPVYRDRRRSRFGSEKPWRIFIHCPARKLTSYLEIPAASLDSHYRNSLMMNLCSPLLANHQVFNILTLWINYADFSVGLQYYNILNRRIWILHLYMIGHIKLIFFE